MTNISLATTDSWRDKATGENQERTEWHRVVFFNRLAEIAGEYLRKGRQVYVEGRLQTRKWQDQNGQDRYTTEIVANEMQMLGGREEGMGAPASQSSGFRDQQRQAPSQQPQAVAEPQGGGDFQDDDIPF